MKTFDGKRIGMLGKYPAISVTGVGQELIHHLVWRKKHGKITKGMVIHHKDGNRMNYKLSNLQLMTRSEHCNLHRNKKSKLKTQYNLFEVKQ
jgi:hypothetical protein